MSNRNERPKMDSKTRLAIYRHELSERLWEIENRNSKSFEQWITVKDVGFLREMHITVNG